MVQRKSHELTLNTAPSAAGLDSVLATNPRSRSHSQSQQSRPRRILPAVADELSAGPPVPQEHRRRKKAVVSPFKDCVGSFGNVEEPHFGRPSNGAVNGYVKVRWASRDSNARYVPAESTPDDPSVSSTSSSWITPLPEYPSRTDETISSTSTPTSTAPIGPPRPASLASASTSPTLSPTSSSLWPQLSELSWSHTSPTLSPQYVLKRSTGEPQLLPPQFGLLARMDRMDKLFWEFCTFKALLLFLVSPIQPVATQHVTICIKNSPLKHV